MTMSLLTEKHPTRYSLESLLNSAVQPLPDLDGEAFEEFRKGIGKGPLADPISISSDGILLDGNQRCRALLANGRKYIDASEVHVIEAANRDNALDYAVELNVARRHLSVEEKVELARKLQRERGWSQARIARRFGVSRPAVSQWFAKHPDPEADAGPVVVTGLDGKTYVNDPPPPPEERKPRNPWSPQGYAYKALRRARELLEREPIVGLDGFYSSKLRAELEDTIEAAEAALTAVVEPAPADDVVEVG